MRPYWHQYHFQDEAPGDTGGAGGGSISSEFDMASAVEEVGDGLGLDDPNDKEGEEADPSKGSATPPGEVSPSDPAKAGAEARAKAEKAAKVTAAKTALQQKGVTFEGKTDDEILALATPAKKGAPKAWTQAMHAHWEKLDPAVQDYLLQRETEVESGFKTKNEVETYGKSLRETIAPYQPLLDAQGIKDHTHAVKFLLNAHYRLSTGHDDARAQFFASLAKSYKVDLAKATAAAAAQPYQETPAEKEHRERLERLEQESLRTRESQFNALKAEADREIAAFAGDPANIYFKDVAEDIALLLQADDKLSLKEAYERAVWANPVTRAKENSRLQADAAEKTRKEAEEKAKAAEKARGTRVRGEEKHRASPDFLGSLDDTLRETLATIKSRT